MIAAADLARCRDLHARARRGWLTRVEQPEYEELSARLFAALAERESRRVVGRRCRRRELRIRRVIQVELAWVNGQTKGMTRDVGIGGFAATVGEKPPAGGVVVARVRLPGAAPVVTSARIVSSTERRGCVSVSVALEDVTPDDAARLRAALLDDALSIAAIHRDEVVDDEARLAG